MGTGGSGSGGWDDDWNDEENPEEPEVDSNKLKEDFVKALSNAGQKKSNEQEKPKVGKLKVSDAHNVLNAHLNKIQGKAIPEQATLDEPKGNLTANNDTAASAVPVDLPAASKIPTPPKLPPMPSATKPIVTKKAVAAKTDPDDPSPVTEDLSKLMANAMAGRRHSLENADDDELEEEWDEEELHEAENEQTVTAVPSSTSSSNPSTTSGPTIDSNMPPSASPTSENAPLAASATNLSPTSNATDAKPVSNDGAPPADNLPPPEGLPPALDDLPPPEGLPPAFDDLPPPEGLPPGLDDLPPPEGLPPVFPGETDENPVISGSVALPVDNAQVVDTGLPADVISTAPIPDEAAPQQSVDNRSPQAKSLNLQGKSVHIYNEIMTTEKTYQKNLSLITDQMVEQILTAFDKIPAKSREGIDRKNVETQLRILQQINKVTEEVIKALEKPDLAEVDKLMQFAKPLYAAYAQVSTPLPIYSEKNKPDLNFGSAEFSPTFGRASTGLNSDTNVNAILIQPIQRAPRYVLLLEDLVKNTNDNSAVHEITKRAHKTSLEIATACNEGKRTFESQARLTAILDAIGKSNSKNTSTTKGSFVIEIAEQLIEQNKQKQPIDLAKAILAAYEKNASYVNLNIGKIPGFTNAESKQALEAARKERAEKTASATNDNTPDSSPVAMSATVGAAAAALVETTSSPATTLDKDGDPRPTRPAPTPTSSPDASLELPQPALDALIDRLKKFESEASVAAQENKKYGSSSAASVLLDVKSAIAIIESNRDNPEQIRVKLAGLIDRTNAPFQPEVSKAFLDVLKGETPDSPTAASASKPYFGTTLPSNENSNPNPQRTARSQSVEIPKEKNLLQRIFTRDRRQSTPGGIETAAPVEPKAPPRPVTAAPQTPQTVASQQPVSTNAAQPQPQQPVAPQQPLASPPPRPLAPAPLTPQPSATTVPPADTSHLTVEQQAALKATQKAVATNLDAQQKHEKKADAADPGTFAELYKQDLKDVLKQTQSTFEKMGVPKDEYEAFAQLFEILMNLLALGTSPVTQLVNAGFQTAWGKAKQEYHDIQAEKQGKKYNDPKEQEERLARLDKLIGKSDENIRTLEADIAKAGPDSREGQKLSRKLEFEKAKLGLLTDARKNTAEHLATLAPPDTAVKLETAPTNTDTIDEEEVVEQVIEQLDKINQSDDLEQSNESDVVLTASTPIPAQTASNPPVQPVQSQAPVQQPVQPPREVALTRLDTDIEGQFFNAILNRDNKHLSTLAKNHDANLVYPDITLINIAKALGNQEAVEILKANGADAAYAQRVDLTKQFGHVLNLSGEMNDQIRLKDGSVAKTKNNAELGRAIHAMAFFEQHFQNYNKTNNINTPFSNQVNEAIKFAKEHYNKTKDHDPDAFYKRIADHPDKPTYLPSGYSSPGANDNHNVGVILYKGYMIVCDGGQQNSIAIYNVENFSKKDITALLNAANKNEYLSTLNKITHGKATDEIHSNGQEFSNCTYINLAGAVQGLNYVQKCEENGSKPDAKKEAEKAAKEERRQFNHASKDAMVAQVQSLMDKPENKAYAMQLMSNFAKKYENKAVKPGKDPIGPKAFERFKQFFSKLPNIERTAFLDAHPKLKEKITPAQQQLLSAVPEPTTPVQQSQPPVQPQQQVPPQRFDDAQNPPPKNNARQSDDDAERNAALNTGGRPLITPMQNRNASTAVASVSQQSLSELLTKLDEFKSENKLSSIGIKEYSEVKAADGKPSHVNIQMYCNKAKTETTDVKAETKPGSDGVTYSMKGGLEGEAREQTIEQICALAVETAKPGTVLSIPSGNKEKREQIEAALDKAFEAKFGDKYEKGNYTIPDAPKSSASLNK